MNNVGISFEAHNLKPHHLGKTITVEGPLVTVTGQLFGYSINGEAKGRAFTPEGRSYVVNRRAEVELTFAGHSAIRVIPDALVRISAAEAHGG